MSPYKAPHLKSFLTAICLVFGIASYSAAQALPDTIQDDSLPQQSETELLELQLQESKLNEMNLRMELEQTKMATLIADSIKRAKQALVIDSLRAITVGFPVIIEDDTLFSIYTNRGGLGARQRAQQTADKIFHLGKAFDLVPDSVTIVHEEDLTTDIVYKDIVLISLTDRDATWMNTTRVELAQHYRSIIVNELVQLKEKYGLIAFLKQIGFLLIIILAQIALIIGINRIYKIIKKHIIASHKSLFKSVSLKKILIVGVNITRYLIVLILLFISLTIIFSIFPSTKDIAFRIVEIVTVPLGKLWHSLIDYIPSLVTAVLIWFIISLVIRILKFFANELEQGNMKIKGFFPEWAKPTFNIIRFLLYAFMVILIYPYLPGSKSDAFQGVSIFIGLVFSLGASSVIANILAGMVLTYMRPFYIGDRIKLNDTIGNVIEKTPFVVRIRTLKNEIVTIPNSTIMSSQTTNLSASARDFGLIIHFEVTCSYDVPWRKVHALLIDAAKQTDNVLKEPEPFVLEQSFGDFYMVYQINAYINDADKLSLITTNLKESIRDKFEEAGISTLSPHVFAMTQPEQEPLDAKEQKKDDKKA